MSDIKTSNNDISNGDAIRALREELNSQTGSYPVELDYDNDYPIDTEDVTDKKLKENKPLYKDLNKPLYRETNEPSFEDQEETSSSKLSFSTFIIIAIALVVILVVVGLYNNNKASSANESKASQYSEESTDDYLGIYDYSNCNDNEADTVGNNSAITTTEATSTVLNTCYDNARIVFLNTSYSDSIETGYQEKWYNFSIAEDGYISIDFSHESINSSDSYWELYLYQSNGTTYYDGGSRYWSVSGDKSLTTCNIGLPAGTYYIKVSPYSSSRWTDNIYTFSVNFSSETNWEKETNNNKYDANPVLAGAVYNGSITNGYDEDWYIFTLDSAGSTFIDFKHDFVESTNIYWEVYLYRSDGTTCFDGGSRYWSVSGEKDFVTCDIGLPAGTYYIKIVPYSSSRWSTANYNFTINHTTSDIWEKEINNNKYNADSISTGVIYNGSITNGYDEDWYVFETYYDGYLNIDFGHEFIESENAYWEIYLYKSDGTSYYDGGSRYWSVSGDKNLATCNIGLPADKYYIKIVPYSSSRWSSAVYNFTVNHIASDTWEKEINNNKYNADPISIGATYNGSITNGYDEDWYVFTVDYPQGLVMVFDHNKNHTSDTLWEIYIYQSDGSTLVNNTYWRVSGDDSVLNDIELESGTYYVKIVPYSSSRWTSDDYSFEFSVYSSL